MQIPADPIAQTARWLTALSAILMSFIAGVVVYFTLSPPEQNLRIGFGVEVVPLIVAAALRNGSQWGYDAAKTTVNNGLLLGGGGLISSTVLTLSGDRLMPGGARFGGVVLVVCLIAVAMLWKARTHYRRIPDDTAWTTDGKGIPLWVIAPVGGYLVVVMALTLRLFFKLVAG